MNKDLFLSDSNNTDITDSFGIHSKIADTITDIISKVNLNSSSFNMGLFGSWGSGKSFIINKLVNNLKNTDFVIFNIDVWKYIGHPLMRSILFDINNQLKYKEIKEYSNGYINEQGNSLEKILYTESDAEEAIEVHLNEICKKLQPIIRNIFIVICVILLFSLFLHFSNNIFLQSLTIPICSGIGFVVAPAIIIELLKNQLKDIAKTIFYNKKFKTYTYKPSFSPEQFEQIFSDIVNTIVNSNKKVLLIFDNLDRCEPKYAYETLSAIKTFMDKKNCFYIIPCDDTAIKKYIAANYNIHEPEYEQDDFCLQIGNEFFDKLFNTYLRIPKLEEIDRDNFIEDELKKLSIYDIIKPNLSEIKQILFYGYKGSTPRQIKRFINDLSINYFLAKNIDLNEEFLLKDLSFFTIMSVIKQKWSNVEEQLIIDANLFSENIENQDYKIFIKKIEKLLPSQLPPLLPFIYMKQTVNEQIISNNLKEGILIENIDLNIVSRIKTEISNMLENNLTAYLISSIDSIYQTLNNIETIDYIKIQLIQLLGEILFNTQDNFVKFLLKYEANVNNLIEIIPYMKERHREIIKKLITTALRISSADDNLNNVTLLEPELKITIFNFVLNNSSIFSKQDVENIFNNITELSQIDESIQSYIDILCTQNKIEYIPIKFIDFIISKITNDTIPENVINCLNKFNYSNIVDTSKVKLGMKLYQYVETMNKSFANHIGNINKYQNIALIMKLLNKESFGTFDINTFNNNLYSIINNLQTYNNEVQSELVIEALYFINNNSDTNFDTVLSNFFMKADNRQRFKNEIETDNYSSYIKNAFSYPRIKQRLLGITDLVKSIYISACEEMGDNYSLLLSDTHDFNNLKAMIEVISDKNVEIDKNKFKNFILENYFDENNLELNYNLFNLLHTNQYKISETNISKYKNATIDCYKENPQNGIIYLKIAKDILTEKQFNKMFLLALFNKIKLMLESTDSVSAYSNIFELLTPSFVKENTSILNIIIFNLLEAGQEETEYELACNLIRTLYFNNCKIEEYKKSISIRFGNLNQNSKNIILEILPDIQTETINKH